jgi:hypothetical protein
LPPAAGQLPITVAPRDPWGGTYTLRTVSAGGLCVFEVRTQANSLPAAAQNAFLNDLPLLDLPRDCPLGVCTSRIPPPGFEAAFRDVVDDPWRPPPRECVPGTTGAEACKGARGESCGNRTRVCTPDGTWGAWGACPKCPCPYGVVCGVVIDGPGVCGNWVQSTGCSYGGYDRTRTCDSRYDCRTWDHNGSCTAVNVCEPWICWAPNVGCAGLSPR